MFHSVFAESSCLLMLKTEQNIKVSRMKAKQKLTLCIELCEGKGSCRFQARLSFLLTLFMLSRLVLVLFDTL